MAKHFLLLITVVYLTLLPLHAGAQDNPLLGYWMTEDKDGVVEFYQCETSYCGRFYWLKEDSAENPSLDFRNNDPAQRNRPLCGLTFLGGFSDAGEGLYDGGWIYSPRHGSMFSANLQIKDKDTLLLRGFVVIPWLGGTQVWTRVENAKACDLLVKK